MDLAYDNTLGKDYILTRRQDLASAIYTDFTKRSSNFDKVVYNSIINPLKIKQIIVKDQYLKTRLNKLKAIEPSTTLLQSYADCLTRQQEYKERYQENIIQVPYDSKSELEKSGLGQHQRDYMCVIDFSQCLDLILSEVFKIERTDIRHALEDLTSKRNLTYTEVSKAILNQETLLLNKPGLDLTLFIESNPVVADFIINSYKSPNNKIMDSFGRSIDLAGYNVDNFSKTSTFFYIGILRYMDHLIMRVIEDVYGTLRDKYGTDIFLTSKGLCSIVIQSNIPFKEKVLMEGDVNVLAFDIETILPNEYHLHLADDPFTYLYI